MSFAQSDATFGVWRADDGNSHIELSPCPEHGLCGAVVWVRPGAVKAQENAAGFRVIGMFSRNANGWHGGQIFIPTRGRAYRTSFNPQDENVLRVRACALHVFCETKYWRRVD
jgi:uncharacterized protein (DUF2147 family)